MISHNITIEQTAGSAYRLRCSCGWVGLTVCSNITQIVDEHEPTASPSDGVTR